MLNGNELPLTTEASKTIASVKAQIESREHVPLDEQVLFFGNKILDNSLTILDYDIPDECVLHLAGQLLVKLLCKDGRNVPLNLLATDTMSKVKNAIQLAEGIPAIKQLLIFDREILENGHTISQIGLRNGAMIYMVLRPEGWKPKPQPRTNATRAIAMHVAVKSGWDDGKPTKLAVSSSDKIGDLKDKIQKEKGIVRAQQRLVWKDMILRDDEKTLQECTITNGAMIFLTHVPKHSADRSRSPRR